MWNDEHRGFRDLISKKITAIKLDEEEQTLYLDVESEFKTSLLYWIKFRKEDQNDLFVPMIRCYQYCW